MESGSTARSTSRDTIGISRRRWLMLIRWIGAGRPGPCDRSAYAIIAVEAANDEGCRVCDDHEPQPLIRMQYHQAQGSKIRPALGLLDTGDEDFVAAPVTSQSRSSEQDLALADWQTAGLNVPSLVRVHKLTVLPKVEVVRRLGSGSDSDSDALLKVLCLTFCP